MKFSFHKEFNQQATGNGKKQNCGALRDLVPFVQFKRREKNPWRSVNFSKFAGQPD